MRFLLPLLCLLPSCAAAQASHSTGEPDTLIVHGHILTGEGLHANALTQDPRYVEALAISHGVVTATGTSEQVLQLKHGGTRVINLHGAFAMPGFNDAHTHMAMAGQQALSVDLVGVRSLAEMQARVRRYVAALPTGTPKSFWLRGGGWDHTLWTSRTLPTRQDLDAVTAGHPALFDRVDGHIAVANTAALDAAQITPTTLAPAGGKFDHTPDSMQLTGIVRETPALALLTRIIPPPTYDMRRRALQHSIDDALAHGVTSVQDFSDWDDWLVLEEMEHLGKLHLRFAEWIDFNLPVAVLRQRRASHDPNDPLLHLTQLKGFMDGSLGSRTAALQDPYSDDAENSGIPRYTQAKLNAMASERAAAGFQLGFHAIGDRANSMALDAFAAAQQAGVPTGLPPSPSHPDSSIVTTSAPGPPSASSFRYRIEHAQVLLSADFARFRELGVIASMQPSHLLSDMAWAPARLGPDRVHSAYAWHRFLDKGVPLAFGTDYPVESIDPFRGLYAATTRRNEAGTETFDKPTASAEVLTLPEALYAYTQAPAYAEFREHTKGLLAPGYFADLIVLDGNPLSLPEPFAHPAAAQQLLHTHVLRTFVGGVEVFNAADSPVPAPAAHAAPDGDRD